MAGRVAVNVLLPSMMHIVAGATKVRVEGATLREALEAVYQEHPALRFHLCEDDGRFRPHVLCFLNDTNTRDMKSFDAVLKDGDEIAIVPAISGGARAGRDLHPGIANAGPS
jgi:molybdopterin converting factor small subunit